REMKVWSRVTHPNVLPFLGFCFFQHANESHSGEPDRISLISPWMQHGTATQYVKDHPGIDNVAIIRGVAEGLQYLHDNQIIHGDIKSGNVLMSECGTPLLSDFGLAILDDDSLNLSSEHITTSTTGVHGTTRWMAPELFPELFLKVSEEDLKPPKSNRETDVWAFGCFVLVSGLSS
ncbi:kinase-like protein, partial [Sistotremastrum niveocremeum HHB9708]